MNNDPPRRELPAERLKLARTHCDPLEQIQQRRFRKSFQGVDLFI
ncbi:hypothetical protein [Microbacterium lacus]|nr:hypothetical protein [Microbacterium lacus]